MNNQKDNGYLVKVTNLSKLFLLERGIFKKSHLFIHAVDGINFYVKPGESLALVGESGSGKTTTGKLLVRLIDPTSGGINMNLDGEILDIANIKTKRLKHYRRHVQMIFQDPYESLNPRKTIYDTIVEPLVVQNLFTVKQREERITRMLSVVGLVPPSTFLFRYPHELSGGQRQRVVIARALIIMPTFVVADEPTSMLDVSVRTGVMHLMQELEEKFNLTYLYITHDLAVARYMTKRIAVMYLGKIVEMGEIEEIIAKPAHPYTKALLSAVSIPDPSIKRKVPNIKGSITEPINPIPRCRFFDRCPIAEKICEESDHPPLESKGGDRLVACYLV